MKSRQNKGHGKNHPPQTFGGCLGQWMLPPSSQSRKNPQTAPGNQFWHPLDHRKSSPRKGNFSEGYFANLKAYLKAYT
jgi:hypothetical protein